jgi:hypothetical protein
MVIYGIDYSKQVDEKRTRCNIFCSCAHICNTNNNKGSNIYLRSEINQTNNLLSKKSDYYKTIELIEKYDARIEVPIKTTDCIIM